GPERRGGWRETPTAASRGWARQSSHSRSRRIAATAVAIGATSDGERRAIAREKRTTESAEASEEPTIIGGSALGGKFERKSASRAALAATCCVIRRKAASVAARTTGRVWSSGPDSPILTSGARRPKDTTRSPRRPRA